MAAESSTSNCSLFCNPDLELALAGPGLGLSLSLADPDQAGGLSLSPSSTMRTLAANEKVCGLHGPIPVDFLSLSNGWWSAKAVADEEAVGENMLLDGQATGSSSRKGKEPLLEGQETLKNLGDSYGAPMVIHDDVESDRAAKKMKLNHDHGRVGESGLMKLVTDFTTTIERIDGKKAEGFLYRFGGGQIGVVCNCHGWIIPVTDFVKHVVGTDLMNPKKRVNLSVSVSPLL